MNYLPRSFEEYFKQSFVSLIISGFMLAIFLQISQSDLATTALLNQFNAFNASLIFNGELFRLVAWSFIHLDYVELFFSILAMLIIGANLERLIGPIRFGLLFISTSIAAGLILVYIHYNGMPINFYLYGPASPVAASIAALVFIRLRRPRWFDDTDLRVLWVFMTVYVIVILSGFALGINSSFSWVVYVSGIGIGLLLSFIFIPSERFDA